MEQISKNEKQMKNQKLDYDQNWSTRLEQLNKMKLISESNNKELNNSQKNQ